LARLLKKAAKEEDRERQDLLLEEIIRLLSRRQREGLPLGNRVKFTLE
jgi:hypothetical protein